MGEFISNREIGLTAASLLEALMVLKMIRDGQVDNPRKVARKALQNLGVK